jgi:hypothetical protein
MANLTFASRLTENLSFTIPEEAVKTLGLHPGDKISVRIEATEEDGKADAERQSELQRRAFAIFDEADNARRDTGECLKDPLEAAWAKGVEEKARRTGLKI